MQQQAKKKEVQSPRSSRKEAVQACHEITRESNLQQERFQYNSI